MGTLPVKVETDRATCSCGETICEQEYHTRLVYIFRLNSKDIIANVRDCFYLRLGLLDVLYFTGQFSIVAKLSLSFKERRSSFIFISNFIHVRLDRALKLLI